MKSHFILIILMALATFLPRLIPLMALKDRKINKNIEDFLKLIPYTSLSILIIRGIMTSDHGLMAATIAGVGLAGILSYIKGNLVLSVLSGIFISFLIINFS